MRQVHRRQQIAPGNCFAGRDRVRDRRIAVASACALRVKTNCATRYAVGEVVQLNGGAEERTAGTIDRSDDRKDARIRGERWSHRDAYRNARRIRTVDIAWRIAVARVNAVVERRFVRNALRERCVRRVHDRRRRACKQWIDRFFDDVRSRAINSIPSHIERSSRCCRRRRGYTLRCCRRRTESSFSREGPGRSGRRTTRVHRFDIPEVRRSGLCLNVELRRRRRREQSGHG